jgi:2-hydroxychromene-2-carboxylate isomerase
MDNQTAKTIELIFDCVSPNAYLIWGPLNDVAQRFGAQLRITPVFLGGMHKLTGNAPPFVRDAEVKGKNAYAMLEMTRFIAKYGLIRYRMNPKFPFNSVTLQRLLLVVPPEAQNALAEAILRGVWEQELDASDGDAVAALLTEAGFDAPALLAATQADSVKQQLIANTEDAVARGAFGIPTMFVGGEIYFGKERLGQIAEQLQAA